MIGSRKYSVFMLCLMFLLSFQAMAQNEEDILRASFHNSFSTARSAGMGGAFGALGADFSSLNTNPAGLALYRRGDFNFTLDIGGKSNSTDFYGNSADGSDAFFKINSLGFVNVQENDNPRVKKVAFGLGLNRTANFHETLSIQGPHNNSLLDVFADQAQGVNYNNIYDQAPINSILAWDAFLIDTISNTEDQYLANYPVGVSEHDITVERGGGINELSFGIAANLSDRFYLGGSMGIPFLNYEYDLIHKESAINSNPSPAAIDKVSFEFTDNLNVEGIGFNIKLGALLKVNDRLRIGGAYHSPTFYSVSETYGRNIRADFDGQVIEPDEFFGSYDYRIRTPMRLMINGAYVAGKSAVISADYEFTDYSTGRLNAPNIGGDGYTFDLENGTAQEVYRKTHNVRVGTEIRLAKAYRARLGARYAQSPYAEGVLPDDAAGPIIDFTTGFGYRYDAFYFDLAAIYTATNSTFFPYNANYVDAASIDATRFNVMAAVGWRF